LNGLVALHGGGEYVTGDEAAMDALVAAARDAAGATTARIVVVPTAVAHHRPDLAVANAERAFAAAATRAGTAITVTTAHLLFRRAAEAPDAATLRALATAHLVHFPGGDPELLPTVLRDTPAWAAMLEAHAAGACIAGASAGAMALGERCWTRGGAVDGLGLVPRMAVLPHYDSGRLAAWRAATERSGKPLTWLGLDEQTLVIGRPGEPWTVAGAGCAHVIAPGSDALEQTAAAGGRITLPVAVR
jgi:cyanophycinase-like exopeptidase